MQRKRRLSDTAAVAGPCDMEVDHEGGGITAPNDQLNRFRLPDNWDEIVKHFQEKNREKYNIVVTEGRFRLPKNWINLVLKVGVSCKKQISRLVAHYKGSLTRTRYSREKFEFYN
jgi:hypothetical protein